MSTEGLKKKDIQRAVQKVHLGTAVSTKELSTDNRTDTIQLGFPAEKLTLVTTGDLVASVIPKAGNAPSHGGIAVSTTMSTTTTSNMFSNLDVVWTSGTGQLIILAK